MKRFITTIFLALSALVCFAQDNTIKFLGIPVDGVKSNMIKMLQQKGFKYDPAEDYFSGEFNGDKSLIFLREYRGKVNRIAVCDRTRTTDEVQTIIRFNNLLRQFKKLSIAKEDGTPSKYLEDPFNKEIPNDEDLWAGTTLYNKDYSANFYLNPYYGLTTEQTEKAIMDEFGDKARKMSQNGQSFEQCLSLLIAEKAFVKSHGTVWFRILTYDSMYYIAIYYDNLDNQPKGEDL